MTTSRVRYRIRGRVQGVGFRWYALQAAERLGLTGWVKNEKDGSVSCEAQGDAGSLSEFARDLERGPRFGSVRDLQREDIQALEETRFEIR